jgi:hypothetical protein
VCMCVRERDTHRECVYVLVYYKDIIIYCYIQRAGAAGGRQATPEVFSECCRV